MMGGDMNGKLTKEVICHACGATVKEINKALKLKAGSKRPEAEVMDIISDVCKMDSFKIYDYPPPKMIRACHKVMDTSEELLEQLFTKRPYLSEEEIEEKGCKKACKGVDKTKDASSRGPDVYVDGVPQKLGSAKPDENAANLRVRNKLPTKAPFWYKNFPPWWINPGALKAEASNYVNDMEMANPIPPKQPNPLSPDKSQSLYEGVKKPNPLLLLSPSLLARKASYLHICAN
eukprot:g8114.t1